MELKITRKYNLDLSGRSLHFVVVGCGGNGSFLIRDLARLIAIKNRDMQEEYEKGAEMYNNGLTRTRPILTQHFLTVCDGDTVEEKNIRRQNFVSGDVGDNKAMIMADRYSTAYGMEINCCNQYVASADHLMQICQSVQNSTGRQISPVIIGCVDNNATRSIMAEFMQKVKVMGDEAYWLDGGNEEFSGQVVLGCTYPRAYKDYRQSNDPIKFATPMMTQIFPEVLEVTDKRPDQMSCDDRAVSFPQCIATNITMATIMLDYCNHFINMPKEGLPCHMVNFDVKRINFSTAFNTEENLKKATENPYWKPLAIKVESKAGKTKKAKAEEVGAEPVETSPIHTSNNEVAAESVPF